MTKIWNGAPIFLNAFNREKLPDSEKKILISCRRTPFVSKQ